MASINKGSTKGAGKGIEQIVDKIGKKITKEISDNLLEKIPSVISKDLLVDINADAEVKGDLEQQIEKKIRENIPKTMTEKTTVVVDPIVKLKSEKGIDLTQFIKLDKDQLNKKIKDLYKLAEQGNETASKQLVSALQVADKIGLEIDAKDKKNYKDYVDYYKDIAKEINTVLNQIDLSSFTSQIDEVPDQVEKNVKKATDNTKKQLASVQKEAKKTTEEVNKINKTSLNNIVKSWDKNKISQKEYFTVFNSKTNEALGGDLAGEVDKITEDVIHKAIDDASEIVADGIIHTHPRKEGVFGLKDLQTAFSLKNNKGITKHIVTGFESAMELDLTQVNPKQEKNILNTLSNYYERIDATVKEQFSKSLGKDAQKLGNEIIDTLKSEKIQDNTQEGQITGAFIKMFQDEYNKIFDKKNGIFSLEDFTKKNIGKVDTALGNVFNSEAFNALPDAIQNVVAEMLEDAAKIINNQAVELAMDNAEAGYKQAINKVFTDQKNLNKGVSSAIKITSTSDYYNVSASDSKKKAEEAESAKKKAEEDAEKARKEAEQEAERKRLEEEERRKAEEDAEKAKREAEEERKRKEEEERRIEEQRIAEAKRKEEEAKAESGISTGQTEVQKTKEETDAIYKKAESIEELYNQIRTLRNINNDIALYEDPNSYIDSGAGKSFSAFDKKKTGSGYEDLKILKKELLELSPILNEVADVTERMSKKDVAKMFGHYFGIELPFTTEKATDIKGIIDAYHEVVNVNKKLTEIKLDSHLAQTLQNYKKQIIELNPVLESVSDHIEEIISPKQWQDKLGDYFKQEQAEAEKTSTITINEFNKIIKKVDLTTASFEELLKYFEMLQKTEFNPQVDKQVNTYRNIGNSLTEAFKNLGYEFDNVSKQWVKIEQQTNNKSIVKGTQQTTTQVDTLRQELAETGQQGQTAGERIAEGMREAREETKKTAFSIQEVYRGFDTPDAYGKLSTTENYQGATFFSSDLKIAQQYGDFVESAAIKLKDAFIIDGKGNAWNYIENLGEGLDKDSKKAIELKKKLAEAFQKVTLNTSLDPFTRFNDYEEVFRIIVSEIEELVSKEETASDKEKKDIYDRKKVLASLRDEYLLAASAFDKFSRDTSHPYGIKTTDELTEYARIHGFDGAVFKNILDAKPGEIVDNKAYIQASDVIVAFYEKQITYLEKIQQKGQQVIREAFQQSNENLVLSDNSADDIGLSYDELIKKVELENEEIAKGNREFKERLTILDAQGKVIASHWGKEKSVDPFTQEELEEAYKKGGVSLFHTHPMDGFFSANDINSFAGEEFNEFILDALGSITKIDFSNLEGPIKKKTGELLSSIVRSIYEPFKENEAGFKHFIDDEAREKSSGIIYEVLKAISNKLKISIDDSESTFKDYGNLLSDVEKSIINHIVEGLNNLDDDPFNIKDFQIKDIIQENLRGYDYKDKNAIIVEQTDDIDILINRFKELRDQTDRSFEKTCELYAIYEKLGGTDILPMKTYLLDEVTDEQLENMRKALEITQSSTASPINNQLDETQKELRETGQVIEELGSAAQQQTSALKAEEQQAEATAQAEKKVVEARQEASTTKPTTGSTTTESGTTGTTTLSSPILSEEQLQKELAKVRETIDKEKEIIKELENELSQEVPKAIQKKNEEFDGEVEKVREVVDKEKAILEELKTYLDTTIPSAIDVKNVKFNEEVGKVEQAINAEIGHLDRLRGELEKPISIDIQKKEEDTFDDSYAFSEAMDRFAKKQQAEHQRKLDNLSALTSELKAKNDARDEEKELQGVKELDNALKEVIEKINLKIASFSHEEDRVKEISHNEAISLQEIIDKLERIKTLATEMKSAFQGIKVDGKIDVKGIKDILQFEGKDFTTVANSLKSLFDALNKLKLGDKSFIKQLDSILAKGKELDNLVKVLNASEKKITQAKESTKSDKEKVKEDSYKKELDLIKQKLDLEKQYKLLEAKGDSKAEETKAKNLVKINQLEKERKQIVDSRKKGETSKELRDQMNAEIKAIKERNDAEIQAEKQATKVRIWNKTEKEFYNEKARKAKEAADAEVKAVKEAEKEKEKTRADKEKAWNAAEKKYYADKAKAAKEAEKAKSDAEKKASQEAKNAERIRKESLEESYGMQKALMKEASDLAIRNLALSDSESEFDIKEVANNNERIAEIGKQINDIVEKRNKLDSDSITLHRELLNYQEELNRDYQTQFDLRDRNKATEHNENAIAAYKELIKTANEYYNLQINTLGKDDNNPDVIRLNELIDKWEEARKAKEEYNDFSTNKYGSNESIQGLKEVEEQFANVEAQVSAKIRESLVKELPKYIKLDKENKYIDKFSDKVKGVIELINKINEKGLDLTDAKDIEDVRKIRDLMAEINSDKGLAKYKKASETRIKQLQLQIRQFQNNNSAMGKTFSEQFDNLFNQFSAARSIAEVDELKGKFASLEAEVVKAGKTGKSFFKTFVEHLKSTNAQLLATYFSFQDIIRYGREFANTVKEVDSAITELRKVSDASNLRLQQSFEQSAKTAKELGNSITNVINQTSDWVRLGYNVDEAEELARITTLFQTVGDNMTTESASETMISTLKAYNLSVDESERIVDQYNEVANNFAIDTAGLSESITRAGAALSAAGNELSESMGLVVAANDSLQDPSSVGQMLKTMSMRLRGASAADLEELGIDTEGMTQGTKSVVKQFKAMAGIDIMEGTNYKTTFQILDELHDKWADLTDAERAALTEAVGGKRGGSVMSSLMTNWEDAQAVVEKAEKSQGSAMKEQLNYAKSIQFSLDRLNASWQELQVDLLNSQAVKNIVDLLNQLVNLLDKLITNPIITGGLSSLGIGGALTKKFFNPKEMFDVDSLKKVYQEAFDLGDVDEGIKAFESLNKKEKDIAVSALKAGHSTEQFGEAINKASKRSKMAASAFNALKVAAISAFTMFVINMIYKAVNAHKELIEHIKSATELYEKEKDKIDQYGDSVKDLYEIINDSNSSIEDQVDARKQLQDIQRSLIEQYGAEASNINLVTTSIEEQSEALKQLADLKESAQVYAVWRNELEGNKQQLGQNDFNKFINNGKIELKEFFNEAYKGYQLLESASKNINPFDLILDGTTYDIKEDAERIAKSNNLIRNDYEKTMDALEEYQNYTTTFAITVDDNMNKVIEAYNNVKRNGNTFEISGNVEDVSATLLDIQTRLSGYPGYTESWANQLSGVLSTTEGIKNELSEAYDLEMKNRINTGQNGEADYKNRLENAYNEYLTAQVSGDALETQNALNAYLDVIKEIENSNIESSIKDYILKPYINSMDIINEKIVASINTVNQKSREAAESAEKLGVSVNDIVIADVDALDLLIYKLSSGDYNFVDTLSLKDEDIKELYEQFKSAYKTNMSMDDLLQLILENSPEVASKMGEASAEAFYDSFASYYNASDDNPIFRKEDFVKWYNEQDWQTQLKLITQSEEKWKDFADTYAKSGKKFGSVVQEDLNTWERYKEGLDEAENRYGEVIYNYRETFGEYYDNENVPHKFGNVDLDDRQVLEWNEETLEQNKAALRSLFEEARLDWDAFKEDMEGSISTVLGSVDTESFGIDIAYTPILQTENGPILLQDKTVHDYIQQLLFKATDDDGTWTTEELLKLDAEGIERNGLKIQGLIADVGDTAIETSQKMHYIGTDGAWNLARKNVENFDTIFAETDEHLLETGEDIVALLERTDDKGAQTTKTFMMLDEAVKGTDKTINEVLEKSSIATSVQNYTTNIKPWLDSLGNAYKSIFSNSGFDINVVDDDMLEDIRSQFENIKKVFDESGLDSSLFDEQALEDFLAVLSDSTTTAEQAQTAFNKYATSLFYSADGLKDLNEETANSIKQMLEQSGVTNYEEVVDYYLELSKAEEEAGEKGLDLTEITREEIEALVESGEIAKTTADALNILAIQKRINNEENPIDTSEEVSALLALGSEAIKDEVILLNLKRVMDMFQQADAVAAYSTSTAEQIRQQAQNIIDEQKAKIQEQLDIDLHMKVADDSKGGGSKDKEEDRIKDQLDVLKWLYDNDVIDYKHYLDQKKVLLDRALAEGLIDNKRYFEEIHTWLRETLELYNSVISYASKLLDKEIDRLEKERDERIKSIEEQRDAELKAIDDEIEAQEEKIKLKEKEIKELQDANEERKREIDLQKKLYDLERSRHQRVNLVEILCQAS